MSQFLSNFSAFVWGPPLMLLLLGTGFFLTFRFKFVQLRGFKHAIDILRGKYDDPNDPGEISHFKALMAALSGTIGTGNIVGVASAILLGGPGAVFWMWITAMIGMASKFTSCTLAVKYRHVDETGETHAGPMHYIELAMGKKYKWLAVFFAVSTVFAVLGMGNMFQINSIVHAVSDIVLKSVPTDGLKFGVGLAVAVFTGMVILGGIKRIAQVAGFLVPFMALFYIGTALVILIKNYDQVLPGFQLIFFHAFNAPEAIGGGIIGGVIRQGVARGLFSNEAGLGTASMAHGAAKTKEPVREGLVAMIGPFIDTIVICSMTALVIVITGAYEVVSVKGQLTSSAFEMGLTGSGWLISLATVLFAFTSIITWSYYGDRAIDYLFGKKAVKPYRIFYCVVILVGAMRSLDDIINFCDAMSGLMALPNLIALIVLSPIVAKMTKEYFEKYVNCHPRA